MKISVHFIILTILLLAIVSLLVYTSVFPEAEGLVYIGEGIVGITLIFLITFYHNVVKPLHSIVNGIDLLREQDFSSRLSTVGQAEADRIVLIFNKMMAQLKAERLRLREQNHFLDLLIDASPMGVILLTLDDDVAHCNPMGLRILGVPHTDITGRKPAQIKLPLMQALAGIPCGETQIFRQTDANVYRCTHSSFIDQGFPHSFYLIESLTDELVKAEKQAYEKVIRLIAHEVNNTTAGITSTLDSIDEALSEISDTDDLRQVMRVCIERCYSMSKFITRFADVVKIPEPILTKTDLNNLIMNCKRFMEGLCLERNIRLTVEPCEIELLRLDAALIEQALLNIVKNAAESIGSNGEIIIRVIAPKDLEIIDNGKGISKDVEDKLFIPFFSTKPNGQGIGLLFIREVLLKHNCNFSLRTGDDGLTRFRIMFSNVPLPNLTTHRA